MPSLLCYYFIWLHQNYLVILWVSQHTLLTFEEAFSTNNFSYWPNQFALICNYWIPKSQFTSLQNSVFSGKCLNYAGKWLMISIGVTLKKKQYLVCKSFFVSLCMIFVFVVSEWFPCTILPKSCVLCVVVFFNIYSNRYLLVWNF